MPPYLRVAGTCAERSGFAARARSRRELRCAGVVADREAYPLAAAFWLVDTRDARADALGGRWRGDGRSAGGRMYGRPLLSGTAERTAERTAEAGGRTYHHRLSAVQRRRAGAR